MIEKSKKKKIRRNIFSVGFTLILFFFIVVYIYCMLIQKNLHADDTAGVALAERVIKYASQEKWVDYTPLTFLNFLFYFFVGWSYKTAYLSEAVIIACIIFLAYVMILSAIKFKDKSEKKIILSLFLLISVMITPQIAFYWRTHCNATLFALLSFICVGRYLKSNKKRYLYACFCINLACCFPFDNLYLCIFLMPLALFCVRYIVHNRMGNYKQYVYVMLFSFLPIFLGKFGYSLLNIKSDLVNEGYMGTQIINLSELGKKICIYITGILELFGANFQETNLLSVSTILYFIKVAIIIYVIVRLIIVARSWVVYEEIQYSNWCHQLRIFSALALISISVVWIISSVASSVAHTPYLNSTRAWGPIFVCTDLACYMNNTECNIAEFRGKILKCKLYNLLGVMLVFSTILSYHYYSIHVPTSAYSEIASKLEEEQLVYGLAAYDYSTTSDLYSKEGKIQLLSCTYNSDTNAWRTLFLSQMPELVENANFSYAVVRKTPEEDAQSYWAGFSPSLLNENYGTPKKIEELNNFYIYNYDYDISYIPQQKKANQLLNGRRYKENEDVVTLQPGGYAEYAFKADVLGEAEVLVDCEEDNVTLQLCDLKGNILNSTNNNILNFINKEYKLGTFILRVINNGKDDISYSDVKLYRKTNRFDFVNSKTQNYANCYEPIYVKRNSMENFLLDGTKGTSRIIITGRNLKNTNVILKNGNKEIDKCNTKYSQNMIILDYEIFEDEKLLLKIENNGSKDAEIREVYASFYQSQYDEINEEVLTKNELCFDGAYNNSNGNVVLEKGGIQFGPYVSLDSDVSIRIYGKNLQSANYNFTSDNGKKIVEAKVLEANNDEMVFEVKSAQKENFEIVISNETESEVEVNYTVIAY